MDTSLSLSLLLLLLLLLQMVGGTVSGSVSALLTSGLGVTLTDFSALPALTIVTAVAKLTALPFIFLAPAHIDDVAAPPPLPSSSSSSSSPPPPRLPQLLPRSPQRTQLHDESDSESQVTNGKRVGSAQNDTNEAAAAASPLSLGDGAGGVLPRESTIWGAIGLTVAMVFGVTLSVGTAAWKLANLEEQ